MGNYDDIIHLPYRPSGKRCHMSLQDRAAQFSPFAALTGFEAAIEETGRLTDCRPQLEAYGTDCLDYMLRLVMEQLPLHPQVTLTCFTADEKKSGGHCHYIEGRVKKIDQSRQLLIMTDGREVPLQDILNIESSQIPDFGET